MAGGWQPYLDIILKGQGVKSAGIYGITDGEPWATSSDLQLSPEEVKNLAAGLKDNSQFQANGMIAASTKYMFLTATSGGAALGHNGPTSFLAIATKKSVIVLTTKDGANPANITGHEFVANDLRKKGF